MSDIKPSSHGIVVEHKESHVRYAVSDKNYNPKVHRKVRDLKSGESVLSYRPKRHEGASEALETPEGTNEASSDQAVGSSDARTDSKTEGSTPVGTKDANK